MRRLRTVSLRAVRLRADDGRHFCPACLETGKTKGRIKSLDNQRTLYDSIALSLAVLPILIFYFTIITAPMALFVAIRYWKTPQSILRRTRIRAIAAIVICPPANRRLGRPYSLSWRHTIDPMPDVPYQRLTYSRARGGFAVAFRPAQACGWGRTMCCAWKRTVTRKITSAFISVISKPSAFGKPGDGMFGTRYWCSRLWAALWGCP